MIVKLSYHFAQAIAQELRRADPSQARLFSAHRCFTRRKDKKQQMRNLIAANFKKRICHE
jgi:hypothetical protein